MLFILGPVLPNSVYVYVIYVLKSERCSRSLAAWIETTQWVFAGSRVVKSKIKYLMTKRKIIVVNNYIYCLGISERFSHVHPVSGVNGFLSKQSQTGVVLSAISITPGFCFSPLLTVRRLNSPVPYIEMQQSRCTINIHAQLG